MAEDFDPYIQWLGIRDPQRPPNHYRLLGVEPFEDDPDVLTNAIDRQMAHVRKFQTGKHSAESQRVLNELATAKLCLLNPQKKIEYDQALRARQQAAGVGEPAGATTSAVGPAAAAADAPGAEPGAGPAGGSPPIVRIAIAVLVAMIVVLLVLILLVSTCNRRGEERPEVPPAGEPPTTPDAGTIPAQTPTEPEAGPAPVAETGPDGPPEPGTATQPEPETQPQPGTQPEPGTQPGPGTEPQVGTEPPTPTSPERLTTASKSIEAARAAMRNRDIETARRQLDLAEKAAYPKDRKQIDQLREVLSPLGAFWRVVERGMQSSLPDEELVVGDRRVIVIDAADGSMVLREGESEKSYTIETLPPELAVAIAERALPDLPSSTLAKAAFLIFDPGGDLDLAGQLCRQAAGQGESTDHLLAELTLARTEREKPPGAGDGSRSPIPNDAARQAALQKIRDVFKDEYRTAQKPPEKGALAGVLFNQGKDTKDNPVTRYVLLVEARDLAVAAGDPALLRQAVEEIAKHYDVDFLEEITGTLTDAAEAPLSTSVRRSLALEALDRAEEAIRTDRYETAAALAEAAHSMALKGRDGITAKQANKLVEELPWLEQQYELFLQAGEVLAEKPDDPEANLVRGKYYCFLRREADWKKGLPLLVKGDDPTLKALAEAETAASAPSPAAPDMVKLGDRWHGAADSVEETLKQPVLARAAHWYRKALPGLSGFTETRVEKQLEEIEGTQSGQDKP